jgi:hypothetical protein
MIKKYWIYIVIIILLISICILNLNNIISTSENNKFEINDTSLITKVFLADRNGNTITLKKHNNSWLVNNKFTVREDAINTLLSTANRIRIKKPVSKAAFKNVIEYIATTAINVEFFIEDEMVKSYKIGSNTPDHLGTYMIVKDSETPFVMHIPSFNGFLSPRYGIQGNTINIDSWRSNNVFNLSMKDINNIKYIDILNQQNSYYLETNPIRLFNSNEEPITFKKQKVLKLLNSFEDLNCESFKQSKYKIDFTKQTEELIINFDTLRIYEMSNLVSKSKETNFTVDRKYAILNNSEPMLIQDYVFNKVLISIAELSK